MFTIMYIYFNFTIINIFLLIVQTAHFNKTRIMLTSGLGLAKSALGVVIGKRLGRVGTSDKASA